LLAFLAAITERIELNTGMTLLTLRPAALAAKQAAEVDLLSGGRLRLGVSVGWQHREMEAVGVDPSTRGKRIEEQIEAMRLLWTQPLVTYHGTHVVLDEVALHPRPSRSIPIWMGGGNFDTGGMPSRRHHQTRRAPRRRLQDDGAAGDEPRAHVAARRSSPPGGRCCRTRSRRVRVGGPTRHPRHARRTVGRDRLPPCAPPARRTSASPTGIVAGSVADQIALITRVAETTRCRVGRPVKITDRVGQLITHFISTVQIHASIVGGA
jgi:hypothetical protein